LHAPNTGSARLEQTLALAAGGLGGWRGWVLAGGALGVEGDDEVHHERGPAGLVGGAQPATVVAVEVLVERDEVAPPLVALEQVAVAVYRAVPVLVEQEQVHHPLRQVVGDLAERLLLPRPGGVLDEQVVA